MSKRNLEMAKTQPDGARDSYVRISKARLSSELKADADRVRAFASDIEVGSMTPGQIADRLRMLATRLSQRSNAARAQEELIEREQEARRNHG